MSEHERPALRVGTLNLRCTWDRWDERAPLLIEQMVELRPDVIGLQEVRVPAHQARWIVDQVNGRLEPGEPRYDFYQRNKTGVLGMREGIAIMSRLPFVERDWLDLRGGSRVAQRARLRAGDGTTFDFYNTHLHHERDAGPMRADQARRIIEWMGRHEGAAGQVLVGDFNDLPDSPPIALVKERMRSAYAVAHGREPEGTAPTPLSAEWDGRTWVIDYIFVSGGVRVHDARLTFDRIPEDDPRLCASDHYGLAADISFG